jgi:hydroxybutyrate-dimer hydrolase
MEKYMSANLLPKINLTAWQSAMAATILLGLSACGENPKYENNFRPPLLAAEITKLVYDGNTDDLLTAGLGKSGLQSATAPTFVDASAPTAAELRRAAIYNNYRALVDMSSNGGFGTLYGPNVDANGAVGATEGKIAGTEYLTYADDGTGRLNVTMVVQIPANFDKNNACIVSASSSGSRGVYGAIATAGEWGLKKGCAVAYTDKGTGNGVHDLAADTVGLINGARTTATLAGARASFNVTNTGISTVAADLTAYNTAFPNRIAFKHAHSGQNPEKDWGLQTLQTIQFAFFIINEQLNEKAPGGFTIRSVTPANTIVIASSVSNGGGAALAAAEQDTEGLIDGIAVAEPNIQVVPNANLTVKRGSVSTVGSGKGLFDYFTYANLLQPCAAIAPSVSTAPAVGFVSATVATSRCAALKASGILTTATPAEQAAEALGLLVAYGWQPEANVLHASHYAFATPAIAVTYANTYGRFGVRDNLCGFSFATTDAAGAPSVAALATGNPLARIFATGNGIPPTSGINIINNLSVGGAIVDGLSVSPSTNVRDFNVDGAQCLRKLFADTDANATKVKTGITEVQRTANLRGKPAIIVHGRSDALIPVAFSSRPYFGVNKIVEGATSKLSYIEVTNAQHFDTFIGNPALAGFDTRFVPLHRYFNQAMDLVYNNLKSNAALPPSQVVRTTPRGGLPGAAQPITANNVPPISATPAATDQITFGSNVVTIPD